jgi:hypothetical protein
MSNTGKRTVHKRHDRVCVQLHFNNIYKEKGVQLDKKHCYEHVPKSVEASQGCKVTGMVLQDVNILKLL